MLVLYRGDGSLLSPVLGSIEQRGDGSLLSPVLGSTEQRGDGSLLSPVFGSIEQGGDGSLLSPVFVSIAKGGMALYRPLCLVLCITGADSFLQSHVVLYIIWYGVLG